MFCSLLGYNMERFLPVWSKEEYVSKEEIDKIRTATKLMIEVKETILKRMDKSFCDKLLKDSKNLQLISIPKEKAKIVIEDFIKKDDTVEVARIVLDTLASVTLELCSNCHKNLEEQEDCFLKLCHFSCGIAPFNPEAEGCPYQMEDVDLKNEFFIDFMKNFLKKVKAKGGMIYMDNQDNSIYENATSTKGLVSKLGEIDE